MTHHGRKLLFVLTLIHLIFLNSFVSDVSPKTRRYKNESAEMFQHFWLQTIRCISWALCWHLFWNSRLIESFLKRKSKTLDDSNKNPNHYFMRDISHLWFFFPTGPFIDSCIFSCRNQNAQSLINHEMPYNHCNPAALSVCFYLFTYSETKCFTTNPKNLKYIKKTVTLWKGILIQ